MLATTPHWNRERDCLPLCNGRRIVGLEPTRGRGVVVARRQAGILTWSELPRDLLRLVLRHGVVNAGSELVELVLMQWIDAHHVSTDRYRVRAEATVHNHAT